MFRAAIITASDKGAAGERRDISKEVIREILVQKGYRIVSYTLIPDEQPLIEKELMRLCDEDLADLIVTTGGTGLSVRDRTPEATLAVADRNIPGIAEVMRAGSMAITNRAMLSRGAAVIRGKTLILNLPGSPKAAKENLLLVIDALQHGLEILRGTASECAQAE
jgi:molybdenum cofactor synthesis domain-containing protein